MGENLQADSQEEEEESKRVGDIFSDTRQFIWPVSEKDSFSIKKCPISDRQLFSSRMQIPLDSAKPAPCGENFKECEREKPEVSFRLCMPPQIPKYLF